MWPNDSPPLEASRGRRLALDPRCVGVVGVAEGLGDHRVAVVDRALDAGGDDRLAGEPLPLAHPDVDGEDHGRGCRDRVVGERGGAGRALRLDLDVDPCPLGGRLQCLGGHVGVGDAGRAGRHGHERTASACGDRGRGSCCGGGSGCGRGGLVAHDARDQLDDLGRRRGRAQAVGELLLHQRPRELGQQLEVGGVAPGRSGDQEGEVGRAVLGPEVDARREAREGQRRRLDPGAAAVRDRDPAVEAGGGGRLAGERVVGQLRDIRRPAGLVDDAGQGANHFVLVGSEIGVESDQVLGDHLRHGLTLHLSE